MEEKKKDALRFLMPSPGKHRRETAPDTPAQAGKGRNGGKKRVRLVVSLLIIGAAATVAMTQRGMKAKVVIAWAQSYNTTSTKRGSISSELPSSGTLKTKDICSITSMIKGEVLSTGLEEGGQVEEDQILYGIGKSSMESQLTNPVNSLTRSQSSYEDALEDHSDALSDYNGNTYKVTNIEYIKELYISVGGKVSGNTKLTDVYSDDIMEIRIPPLSEEVAAIGIDIPAAVTLTDTGEQVAGTVKVAANQETVLTDRRLAWVITIQVSNPGGLTTSLEATAQIGEFIGSEDGVLKTSADTTMNADLFTNVKMESLLVNIGDYVTKGTPALKMTDKSADKLVQGYKGALDKTKESVESTQDKLNNTQDNYDNYTTKMPISGQVITKNFKMGDNITRNSSSTAVLATIYDLSSLTFEMFIDGLDIKKVKVGQKIRVSADTLEGQTFSGIVTNVSLESTYSNEVNAYPVTATLDDIGDLLPDANVDGVITLEEANGALAISADVSMRGSQVYVKDDTMTGQQGPVPTGFRTVKVEAGLTSDAFVEIKSGLSEGDVAYVAEPSKDSSSVMIMMDGGMGGPPGGDGNMGGGNRDGSEGGRQNR